MTITNTSDAYTRQQRWQQGSQNRYSSGFQIQRNRTGKPTKPTG
jgi:hypothetical protein